MRISELSEVTGMPIATLKFYLREGVLHPGEAQAKTQSFYDDSHVERVRLVRALTEVGGLSIAATKMVVDAMNDPQVDRLSLLATAQKSLAPPVIVPRREHPLARQLLDKLGWEYSDGDRMVDLLERQLEVADEADVGMTMAHMVGLARMAHHIAEVDISLVPDDATLAVRNTVLGTAVSDKLLITLRRLAQSDVARRAGAETPQAEPISD